MTIRNARLDALIRQLNLDLVSAKEAAVTARFGRLFRNPDFLSKQDYLDFLKIDHNQHWSNLHRLGWQPSENMRNLRLQLRTAMDPNRSLAERIDEALENLPGVNIGTLSPMLLVAFPQMYGVMNALCQRKLQDLSLWPTFPRGTTTGQKYEIVNEILNDIAKTNGLTLWAVDTLWWVDQNAAGTSEHSDPRSIAVDAMVKSMLATVEYSNGQTVEKVIKFKTTTFQGAELSEFIVGKLDESHNRCSISGLKLEFDGDPQLYPSLDRIDSRGHYVPENLQVVARFINFWKNNMADDEFRRLLKIVRGDQGVGPYRPTTMSSRCTSAVRGA
ncbi:hypothetical protein [Paracoccus sanguinis]|uniref:hypothetical protein n=1 Tax=Paracoccus sanguinis TaxID=1545044 RepID=UPI0018CD099E|nr:hypothetical protein [Paracoccus sanguinis]